MCCRRWRRHEPVRVSRIRVVIAGHTSYRIGNLICVTLAHSGCAD